MEAQGNAALSALEEFCGWTAADYADRDCHLGDLGSMEGLAGWRDAVLYGRGFALLRRVRIEALSPSEGAKAFASLAGQFGTVTEPAMLLSGKEIAIPLATRPTDLSALACLSAPPTGLAVSLASGVDLHNRLLREAEDVLVRLYQAEGDAPPPFRRRGAKLTVRLGPDGCGDTPLGRATRIALAEAERDALKLELEPGDLLIVNNRHNLIGSAARAGALIMFPLRAQLVALSGQAASAANASADQGASRAA